MLRHLSFRNRLIAVAVPPLVVLGVVAAYAVALSLGGSAGADELASDIRSLGALALASFLLSALTVIVVGRSISDPVDELATVADELADKRLPRLLESLRSPNQAVPVLEPLMLDHKGEATSRLATALNTIQGALAEVAEEHQKSMRQGLSELVVNLARRNQSLLDRQIEYIDELEASEEDPKRLEELFSLDHLATRMRRNAESLLVVAGVDPPKRRGGPVSLSDILRVALSEIEDYRDVEIQNVDDDQVAAQPAIDLAHLMAELLENATQFSPPGTPVEVAGAAQSDGAYLISVVDHGVGIAPEKLGEANELLANPPDLELGLSRSLGFMVIGRLAKRLEVRVELAATSGGGITSLILLPASLLVSSGQARTLLPADSTSEQPAAESTPAAVSAPAADSTPAAPEPGAGEEEPGRSWTPPPLPTRGSPVAEPAAQSDPGSSSEPAAPEPEPAPQPAPAPQPDPSSALAKLMGTAPITPSPAPSPASGTASDGPAKLSEAIPSGERFDAGVASLLPDTGTDGDGRPVERTASGLVKRDRSRSQAPAREGRHIPGGQSKPVAASARSPEEIRQMLSRYRGGKNRSGEEASDDTTSNDPDSRAGGPR